MICITIGAAVIGIAFLIFVLQRASLSEILKNIPYILSDPAHPHTGFIDWIKPFLNIKYVLATIAVIVFLHIGLRMKKYRKHIFIAVSALLSIASLIIAAVLHFYNFVSVPFAIIGIVAYVFTVKKDNTLFIHGYLLSVMYAVCLTTSRLYAVGAAMLVAASVSVFFIKQFTDEVFAGKYKNIALYVLVLVQIMGIVILDTDSIWNTNSDTLITQGPSKGIYAQAEKAESYNSDYENIKSIRDYDGKRFMVFKEFVEGNFLLENTRNASMSSGMWDNCKDLNSEFLNAYYAMNPENIPDLIYVDSKSSDTWSENEWEMYGENKGYAVNFYENGAVLLVGDKHEWN